MCCCVWTSDSWASPRLTPNPAPSRCISRCSASCFSHRGCDDGWSSEHPHVSFRWACCCMPYNLPLPSLGCAIGTSAVSGCTACAAPHARILVSSARPTANRENAHAGWIQTAPHCHEPKPAFPSSHSVVATHHLTARASPSPASLAQCGPIARLEESLGLWSGSVMCSFGKGHDHDRRPWHGVRSSCEIWRYDITQHLGDKRDRLGSWAVGASFPGPGESRA